jgi:hypothetical protein
MTEMRYKKLDGLELMWHGTDFSWWGLGLAKTLGVWILALGPIDIMWEV